MFDAPGTIPTHGLQSRKTVMNRKNTMMQRRTLREKPAGKKQRSKTFRSVHLFPEGAEHALLHVLAHDVLHILGCDAVLVAEPPPHQRHHVRSK